MVKFICDYCGKEYVLEQYQGEYSRGTYWQLKGDKKIFSVNDIEHPCNDCMNKADTARDEKLREIKQRRNQDL